jgi:hypothetical protein
MNITNILHSLHEADPEFGERISPRRRVIKNFTRTVSLAALPIALGGLFKRAYGKTNDIIVDTLNLALLAEMLEVRFYRTGLDTINLITSAQDKSEIELIYANEFAHRRFVTEAIQSLGGTPRPEPTFDFSGGSGPGGPGFGMGPYADVFSDYPTFLAVAQTFETNGVRAYKGGAPNLMGNNAILEAALNIHSVEARHAAHLMIMRRRNGHATDIKPWLTGADPKIPAGPKRDAAAGVYAGEDKSTQGTSNTNIVGIGNKDISFEDATEAFDEPLSATQVMANVDPFVVG